MTVAELPPEPEDPYTVTDSDPAWIPDITPIPGYVWNWDSDAGVWMYVPERAISPTRPDMPTVTDDGRIVYDPLLLERYRPDELTDLLVFDPGMFRLSRRTRARMWIQDRVRWLTSPNSKAVVVAIYLAIIGAVIWIFA